MSAKYCLLNSVWQSAIYFLQPNKKCTGNITTWPQEKDLGANAQGIVQSSAEKRTGHAYQQE